MDIKSNLRVLMAFNGIKSLRELGENADVTWEILKRLDENINISKIRFGNIFKVARALNCSLDQLILIPKKAKKYEKYNLRDANLKSNLKILMALNNINTQEELIRLSGVSYSVISKIEKGEQVETIELHNLLKVCAVMGCSIDQLINIDYDYDIKNFSI